MKRRSLVQVRLANQGQWTIQLTESLRDGPPPADVGVSPDISRIDLSRGTVTDDELKAYGTKIADALSSCGEARKELEFRAEAQPGGRDVHPLHIELVPSLEDVPWELLHQQKFIALDPRQPVARVVPSHRPAPDCPRPVELPLRLTMVLAAEGIDLRSEAETAREALSKVPVDVDVQLLLSDPQLIADFDEQDWCTAGGTGSSATELLDNIAEHRPHILHLSCHGRADAGAFLEIATPLQHIDPGASPIQLEYDHFAELRPEELPWLLVLNACEGGASAEAFDGASLASSLVRLGVPAVVAMREPVPDDAARLLTRHYLPAALKTLYRSHRDAHDGAMHELIWERLLGRSRRELRDKFGTTGPVTLASRAWSLPVLYLGAQPLWVRRASSSLSRPRVRELEEQLVAQSEAAHNRYALPPPLLALMQELFE